MHAGSPLEWLGVSRRPEYRAGTDRRGGAIPRTTWVQGHAAYYGLNSPAHASLATMVQGFVRRISQPDFIAKTLSKSQSRTHSLPWDPPETAEPKSIASIEEASQGDPSPRTPNTESTLISQALPGFRLTKQSSRSHHLESIRTPRMQATIAADADYIKRLR